ncbi:hypothetical protein SNE40_000942 [Patella caerulea]|uniref:Uncharacterized protein n=1 Tax=Patella caerulea TaxID=87958 RepID=A0AAN8KHL1_PATCE
MVTSQIHLGCLLSISCFFATTVAAPVDISNQEEVKVQNICKADFVEKFFRLLSGPVGREAEALVASVLKLLSENDRVHLQSSFPNSKHPNMDDSMSREVIKRLQPKFNPTGWRRKRDATQSRQWNRYINSLYNTLEKDSDQNEKESVMSTPSWPKRSPWVPGRPYRYFGGAFKLKRKPLKFNPTGW